MTTPSTSQHGPPTPYHDAAGVRHPRRRLGGASAAAEAAMEMMALKFDHTPDD